MEIRVGFIERVLENKATDRTIRTVHKHTLAFPIALGDNLTSVSALNRTSYCDALTKSVYLPEMLATFGSGD